MKFTKLNSLSYDILCSLIDIAGGLGEVLLNPPTSMSQVSYRLGKTTPSQKLNRSLSQLKQRNIIQEKKRNGLLYLELTKRGKLEIIRVGIREKRKLKWDGKWRMVIFDVPEISRKDRDFLRNQLQWLGFHELQKSVWIFPHDVQTELKEFIKLCKIELEGDIRFLVVESIDSDQDLKHEFDLT